MSSTSPAWISTLKRTLGHDEEPHPGTAIYERRRCLTDSIASLWQSHLCQLVKTDIRAGAYGRRKHFWEEMECIVVYELEPSLECASRDEQLSTLALHTTYVLCPGFSGRNLHPSVAPPIVIPESRPLAVRSSIVPIRAAVAPMLKPPPESPSLSLRSLSTASLSSARSSFMSSSASDISEFDEVDDISFSKNEAPDCANTDVKTMSSAQDSESNDWSCLWTHFSAAQTAKSSSSTEAKNMCLLSDTVIGSEMEFMFLAATSPLLPVPLVMEIPPVAVQEVY